MDCSAGIMPLLLLLLLFHPHYVSHSSLVGSQKSSTGLTDQILLIHSSAKSFLSARMN